MTTDPASILPAIACTDCLVTSGLCVYTSGPNAGKPRAARYGPHKVRVDASVVAAKWYDRGVSAGAASRQPDVDAARTRAEAAEAAVSKGQADVAALKQQLSDANAKIAELERPPVVVTGRPVPADALYVHPQAGADTNAGTLAKPRKTFLGGAYNVPLPADYSGVSFESPKGKVTTLHVRDGETVALDGEGAGKRILTASGVLNLYGDGRVVNAGLPALTINGVPIYYGGTSAGSEIDGWTISNATAVGLGFQVPLVLTELTVESPGHSGILGVSADGTQFGRVRVLHPNRGNHAKDGQLGGIKMTLSKDLYFGPDVYVEDANGGHGLWTDWSCRNATFARSVVKTGATGKPAYYGLLIEETEGGTVAGVEVEGQYNSITASGHVNVWNSELTGTITGLQIRQDRPRKSPTNSDGIPVAEVPWWAVDNVLANNVISGPTALSVYANPGYPLTAKDMLAALKGNTFNGKVNLEGADGKRTDYTPAQLAALLGTAYDPAAQPVPEAVAGLLA